MTARSGSTSRPSGWRGPKIASTANSTTMLRTKFASADSTLAAGSSCTGRRTFFTIAPFATIDAAPWPRQFEKNVQGMSPTNRKIGYSLGPVAVCGRFPKMTPNRIQNTPSWRSGMTKFQPKPSIEPLYRARSSRQAKSCSSWRCVRRARRSAITLRTLQRRIMCPDVAQGDPAGDPNERDAERGARPGFPKLGGPLHALHAQRRMGQVSDHPLDGLVNVIAVRGR